MHPLDLKNKYDLSFNQLSELFNVSHTTVRRWAFREGAKGRTTPPPMAFQLAKVLDYLLSAGIMPN